MKKSELKELYQMMFPDYPDIVTVQQLREMLGISRQLPMTSSTMVNCRQSKSGTVSKSRKSV